MIREIQIHPGDVRSITRLSGVLGAAMVSRDGLVVSHAGSVSPLLYAHLARAWFVSRLEGVNQLSEPRFHEIHWPEGVLLVLPTAAGFLTVIIETDANIGKLRLELMPLVDQLAASLESLGGGYE